MGVKDTKAKEFLKDNCRFADAVNYGFFHGKQVVKAENLREKDISEVLSVYGTDKKEIQKQKWRDLLKQAVIKQDDDVIYLILGIENQSDIHYAMPVKNMIYDAMNYGSQVTEAVKKHKKDKDYGSNAEFLSGFKKEDKLTPVITLTLYLGARKWDAPRCLHDMFRVKDKGILKQVDNYHLHLIVPQEISDFDKFQTSLGEVLEVIKASENRNALEKVLTENPAFQNLENEAVSAINVFTGIDVKVNEKEGKDNMCKAWEDQRLYGEKIGEKRGEKRGEKQGIIKTLVSLVKDGLLSLQEAAKRADMSEEEFKKLI